jgi:hypothetical protein
LAEEKCCDAWVVEHQSGTRRTYAEALLATIDFLNEPTEACPPAACGLGEVRLLQLRLTQIMRGQLAPPIPRLAWLGVLVCGLAIAPLQPAIFARPARVLDAAVAGRGAAALPTPADAAKPSAATASLIEDFRPATTTPASRIKAQATATAPAPAPAISPLPAAFAPSRLYASVFSPNRRFQLEARTGRKTMLIHENGWRIDLARHEVACSSISPDSRFFVTGHKDGTMRQWDSETGDLIATLATNAGPITSIAYSPDGTQLALGTYDGEVGVWDAVMLTEVARRQTGRGAVSCVRWSPHGDRLAVALGDWASKEDSRLHIWAPKDGVLVSDDPLAQPAGALDWLSDDALLVAYWDGGGVVRNLRGHAADQPYQIEKDLVSAANWSSDVRLVTPKVAEILAAGAGL